VNLLGQREHVAYFWHVLAHSLYPPVTIRSIEQFQFVLDTTQNIWPWESTLPREFSLNAISPNPFNATTTIAFDLPRLSDVSLRIFEINGRVAATLIDAELGPGSHRVQFDGELLASGVYFVRLQAGEFTATRKLLLLK
jgi:hypothetical protein